MGTEARQTAMLRYPGSSDQDIHHMNRKLCQKKMCNKTDIMKKESMSNA